MRPASATKAREKFLAEAQKRWEAFPIKLRSDARMPHYDRLRVTPRAYNVIRNHFLNLADFIGGQNKQRLVKLGLRYVPLYHPRKKDPYSVGAIVTEDEAKRILARNYIRPKPKDMHDIKGLAFQCNEKGIWTVKKVT